MVCSGIIQKLQEVLRVRCEFTKDCPYYDPQGECNEASHTRCGQYKKRKYGSVMIYVKKGEDFSSTKLKKETEK